MAEQYPLVKPGQHLQGIPAAAWNKLMEIARSEGRAGAEGVTRFAPLGATVIKVRNMTGADIEDSLVVLGLDVPTILPSENLTEFLNAVTFDVVTPVVPDHVGKFAILLEPLRDEKIGKAVLAGACPCRLVIDTGDMQDFADINDGETTLITSETGSARILWSDDTSLDNGTATAGASTTLTDSGKSWTTDQWDGWLVHITAGTGAGQVREIASNTGTVLTVTAAWDTNPSTDSEYALIPVQRLAVVRLGDGASGGGGSSSLTVIDSTDSSPSISNVTTIQIHANGALSDQGGGVARINAASSTTGGLVTMLDQTFKGQKTTSLGFDDYALAGSDESDATVIMTNYAYVGTGTHDGGVRLNADINFCIIEFYNHGGMNPDYGYIYPSAGTYFGAHDHGSGGCDRMKITGGEVWAFWLLGGVWQVFSATTNHRYVEFLSSSASYGWADRQRTGFLGQVVQTFYMATNWWYLINPDDNTAAQVRFWGKTESGFTKPGGFAIYGDNGIFLHLQAQELEASGDFDALNPPSMSAPPWITTPYVHVTSAVDSAGLYLPFLSEVVSGTTYTTITSTTVFNESGSEIKVIYFTGVWGLRQEWTLADGEVATFIGWNNSTSDGGWQKYSPTGVESSGFGAGSASAPSVFAAGDTNTGIYWSAADAIAITCGGTNVVTFTSGGSTALFATPIRMVTGNAIQANTNVNDTLVLQARDVNDSTWVTFITLTSANTPTCDLATGVTIGSAYIYRAGGTDVPLADGGTGASLSDPGADRILFWDDSADAVTWLTVGTGLSISGTTLSASGLVSGPGSSTDNAIVRWNGTGGATLQDSVSTLSDTGLLTTAQVRVNDLYLVDIGSSPYAVQVFAASGDLSDNRYLQIDLNDGNRTLTVAGDATVSGTNTGDQTVTGTADKITVTGGGGAAPTVTIASTYAGQTSITTLGTIVTGTWTGTAIAVANGGTGATDAATARTNLGLAIGTNVQAYDAELAAIAGLTSATDRLPYFNGAGSAALAVFTSAGRALLDDASASDQRNTLGLGTIATQNANSVTITGGSITGMSTPSGSSDVATKGYVDSLVNGLKWKQSVVAATTTAGTLATSFENGDTLDGVTLATGDRILIKNQADSKENGIYVVAASGAPARASDADSGTELESAAVFVSEGVVNSDTAWVCTEEAITIGVSSIFFESFLSTAGALIAANNLSDVANAGTARTNLGLAIGTDVQAYDAGLAALAAFNTNGILCQTANNTFAGRTLTGTANQVVVSNGDGVSGNPTLSLPQSIATSSTVQFAAIELGHASDTTIARSGSGDITIEGNAVYRAGGTDVPVADGGTGRSSHTAYAVICGGTSTTAAQQSIASVGVAGEFLMSNGAGSLPTFQDFGDLTVSDADFDDSLPFYDLSAAANRAITPSRIGGFVHPATCDHRLTLTSGTPVTTSDVTSAGTLYFSPYVGNRIALHDGTRWALFALSEIAISVSGIGTTARSYDVWCFTTTRAANGTDTGTDILTLASAPGWATGAQVVSDATSGGLTKGTVYYWNAASSTTGSFHATLANALAGSSKVNLTSTVTANITGISLETLAWSSGGTSRATAIVNTQDGVWTKSGDTTRKYVGTIAASGSGTTEDSVTKRFVWNNYHRVARHMVVQEDANSWTQVTPNVWRQAGADAANQLELVRGIQEDLAHIHVHGIFFLASAVAASVGVGIDSTTVNSAQVRGSGSSSGVALVETTAEYRGHPGLGYHYLAWLEQTNKASTNWYGDNNVAAPDVQSGMVGTVWA